MCTNYRPGSRDFVRERFGIDPDFDYVDEAYPASAVPIVRRGAGGIECVRACFGLIPHWARDTRIARSTYNARSETVAGKPSFRRPWCQGQFCLVPMQAFYEPNCESGRAVRWRIERADGGEFAVAGIWETWRSPTAVDVVSFSMLTINADDHPLMRRFHAAGDEKRSIVVLEPEAYARWLSGDAPAARALLHGLDPASFVALADPRPGREDHGLDAGAAPCQSRKTSMSMPSGLFSWPGPLPG
jgi:putative SOS response-associated peptidase YedK